MSAMLSRNGRAPRFLRFLALTLTLLAVFASTAGGPSATAAPATENATSSRGGVSHGWFLTTDGLKIHYMVAGRGVPVVLIHGYTGSAEGNWFSNGVAEALVETGHRVIAIDCRGHGQSDKPHDPKMYGERLWRDVIEMMDHLAIRRAHVHGYSMGGMITTQLLANAPGRIITAAYGGMGVAENDEAEKARIAPDKPGPDPQEEEARATLSASPSRDEKALTALRGSFAGALRSEVDLRKVKVPVLAIIGEYDKPNERTHRMKRELKDFEFVMLPGKSHLTAIMAGYIPDLYITSLVRFINEHDPKKPETAGRGRGAKKRD